MVVNSHWFLWAMYTPRRPHVEINLNALADRQAHDLIASSIIPRPIAWVTSINAAGAINIAPYSFFTGIQWYPPVLAFSVVNRANGSKKDTIINIEQTGEFAINIVSTNLLKDMEQSARRIPYGEDEFCLQDIALTPSKTIKPSRITADRGDRG